MIDHSAKKDDNRCEYEYMISSTASGVNIYIFIPTGVNVGMFTSGLWVFVFICFHKLHFLLR